MNQWNTYGYPNNWGYTSGSQNVQGQGFGQPQQQSYGSEQSAQNNQILISTPKVPEEQQPTYISGRYVQDVKSIRPNEVRPDGNPTVFPLVDRSAIITKELNEMGTIDTYVYVRQEVAQNNQNGQDPIQMIMDRLDNIEKEIKKTRYYKGNKNKGGNQDAAT